MSWLRIGDINEPIPGANYTVANDESVSSPNDTLPNDGPCVRNLKSRVAFQTYYDFAALGQAKIEFFIDDHVEIGFYGTHIHEGKIDKAAEKLKVSPIINIKVDNKPIIEVISGGDRLIFSCKLNYTILIQHLLKDFIENLHVGFPTCLSPSLIPPPQAQALFGEIQGVLQFLYDREINDNNYHYQHQLPIDEYHETTAYPDGIIIDPEDETLAGVIAKVADHFIELNANVIKAIMKRLAADEDPDRPHGPTGRTPIYLAEEIIDDDTITELLLFYHSKKAFCRITPQKKSAYEDAIYNNKTSKLALFNAALSKPTSTIRPIYVTDIKFAHDGEMSYTRFHFADDKVIMVASGPKSKFSDEILKQLANVFNQSMNVIPEEATTTLAFIKQQTNSDDCFIDVLIADEGEVIGFNIFEYIYNEAKKKAYTHGRLAVILPEYRHYQIMPLVTQTSAFILQMLLPDYEIVVGFFPLVVNTYNVVKSYHFPKHYSHKALKDVLFLTDYLFGEQPTMDGISSYVPDIIQIKDSGQKRPLSLLELFFKKYLQRYNVNEPHAVTVVSYMDRDQLQETAYLVQRVGINIYSYLQQRATNAQECGWIKIKNTKDIGFKGFYKNDPKTLFYGSKKNPEESNNNVFRLSCG